MKLLEEKSIYKLFSKADIRNIMMLLKVDESTKLNTNSLVMALKILTNLSQINEFVESFVNENIHYFLIQIIDAGLNETITLDALYILHNVLSSKEIIHSLFKMDNNIGLITLVQLINPPISSNVYFFLFPREFVYFRTYLRKIQFRFGN